MVGRLQLHGICGCRLVYREVVEARSNYITALVYLTGISQIEKEQVCVPHGIVRGKGETCNLLCTARL